MLDEMIGDLERTGVETASTSDSKQYDKTTSIKVPSAVQQIDEFILELERKIDSHVTSIN